MVTESTELKTTGIENKGVELAVGSVNIGSIGGLQLRVLNG